MKKHMLSLLPGISALAASAQKPSPELLNPSDHTLVMIDHEGQMAFATKNITADELQNNLGIVAGASKIFKVPTVITTVAERSFAGPVLPEIKESYLQESSGYIDRTTMDTWEDVNAHKAITGKNKKKIFFSGLWTRVCIVGPVLSAISEGYEVYILTDACRDVTKEAHDRAITSMVQAGARPMTAIQHLPELQRDWSRKETYVPVNDL